MAESQQPDTKWILDWQDAVDAVGQDFSDGEIKYGADAVDATSIRRYLEPLEFDCPLHYDLDVARGVGLKGLIAPYTSAITLSIPPMWGPGEPSLFDDPQRNAQPNRSPILSSNVKIGPPTSALFATDIDLDILRPIFFGERVGRRGNRLMSCVPKETSVGRGAFMVWQSEIVDARGDVVARLRTGLYAYVPFDDHNERSSTT